MKHVMKTDLPEYENPPVGEVVCGVQFKTLEKLRIPHFGLFWEGCKAEYPRCQEVAPLIPLVERFGADEGEAVQLPGEVPLPRVWFLNSEETGIIQVQRDRFLHNWKKVKSTDKYPRYHTVIELFKRQLGLFEQFLAQYDLGEILPVQYEMTYVNHIRQGDGWENLSELSRVFRDYSWRNDERFLPGIEHINLRKSFELPERMARLYVSIRDGKLIEGQTPVILFELTVRGIPGEHSREAMWKWFDVAREWIVRGFTDLTSDAIQKNVWRRTR
jgi:uncharacterized protein (TIGR04255 family)